jgi:hypothetical protein
MNFAPTGATSIGPPLSPYQAGAQIRGERPIDVLGVLSVDADPFPKGRLRRLLQVVESPWKLKLQFWTQHLVLERACSQLLQEFDSSVKGSH